MEALLETWRINDRINLYLLSKIPPEQLATSLEKGKSVASNFKHIHNVRLMWLKASAPDLHEGLTKFERDTPDHAALEEALIASGKAIEELVRRAGTPDGRVKNFKPHAAAFVGYMLAHEAFHRAMAEIALRQAGTPITQSTEIDLWEWGKR